MTQLTPFRFESHDVRTVTHDNGNLWWVAKDVCAVLGIVNVSDAVGRLESDERSDLQGIGETDTALIINESGLYRLIFRSNKPEAKVFQHWVFHEVLPQIRQTGRYAPAPTPAPAPQLTAEEKLERSIRLATMAKNYLDAEGQLTSRDRLMFADNIRTAYVRAEVDAQTQATSQTLALPAPAHFDIAERVKALGYTLTRQQSASLIPRLGRAVAQEYRSRYGTEPGSTDRYVDGAVRPVKWYPLTDAEWIDTIMQATLAQDGITR